MTDPVVRLEPTQLTVEPGGQTRTVVTVRNLGTIVEGFRIDVVDDAGEGTQPDQGPASWAEVMPPEIQVYPQQEATAVVVFSPAAGSAAPGGGFPFGVRAMSVVDGSSSAVAEGTLDVGRVFGLQSKLTPVTSSGRWRGRHKIELTNWGNAPARLRLVASDPDDRLGFLVNPEIVDVPLGGTSVARLKVRTRKPFLRGTPVRLPFQVVGEPDPPDPAPAVPPSPYADPRRPVMDGALTQRPILSRMTVAIGGLVVVAGIAAAVFALRAGSGPETYEAEGPPGTPTLAATATAADTIQLSWPPMERIEKYEVLTVDATSRATTGVIPVPGEQAQHDVSELNGATSYCFQIKAVRGSLESSRSEVVCATTPPAPDPTSTTTPTPTDSAAPTDSPPPGGTGAGTGGGVGGTAPATGSPSTSEWIAVLAVRPGVDSGSEASARQAQQELVDTGVEAEVLLSTDYPGLGFEPTWVVYVGGFESQAAVAEFCQSTPPPSPATDCQAEQPRPAS